jgi:hypothetical protein
MAIRTSSLLLATLITPSLAFAPSHSITINHIKPLKLSVTSSVVLNMAGEEIEVVEQPSEEFLNEKG